MNQGSEPSFNHGFRELLESPVWGAYGSRREKGIAVVRIPENKNAGPADEEMQQFKKDCEKLAGASYNVQRANAGRLDGWELHFVQSPAVADEHFFLDRPLERIREIITACVGAPSPAWQHASFVDQRRIHVPVGNPDDAQLEHELSVLENAGWLVLDSDQESG